MPCQEAPSACVGPNGAPMGPKLTRVKQHNHVRLIHAPTFRTLGVREQARRSNPGPPWLQRRAGAQQILKAARSSKPHTAASKASGITMVLFTVCRRSTRVTRLYSHSTSVTRLLSLDECHSTIRSLDCGTFVLLDAPSRSLGEGEARVAFRSTCRCS